MIELQMTIKELRIAMMMQIMTAESMKVEKKHNRI